jgi:hypothetical protein
MFAYVENLARLDVLRDDLEAAKRQSSIKAPNYDGTPPTMGYIDNIPGRIIKAEALERLILDLERWTKPITRLLRDLENPHSSPKRQEMLKILRVRYIHGNTWDRTIALLKMPRDTFSERRKELVKTVIRYMGLESRTKIGLKSD